MRRSAPAVLRAEACDGTPGTGVLFCAGARSRCVPEPFRFPLDSHGRPGAVDQSGRTAELSAVALASQEHGGRRSDPASIGVIVGLSAKEVWRGRTGLVSVSIITGVAAEEVRAAFSDLIALCVIVGVAAKEAGPALTDLMTLGVVVDHIAPKPFAAVSLFLAHMFCPPGKSSMDHTEGLPFPFPYTTAWFLPSSVCTDCAHPAGQTGPAPLSG